MSSFYNEKQIHGMKTGEYVCSACGKLMELEDGDTLVCPYCSHSIDWDRYGFENEEDYNKLYPTLEDLEK